MLKTLATRCARKVAGVEELCSLRVMARMENSEELGWLAAARRGETAALERFYACYQPQVYALCLRLLSRAEDAEDAMQATFVQAFRALPQFRGDCSLKTWVYRIAVNQAFSLLRKRRQATLPLDENLLAAESTECVAEQIAVQAALARVKPAHRVVLILRYWEQLEYTQISEVLGVSLPAVKMRLNRAREEFRRWYEHD